MMDDLLPTQDVRGRVIMGTREGTMFLTTHHANVEGFV